MDPQLTPAVGYVRMSSDKQEASPEQQRAEILKLAKKHKCEVIRWYADEGISGDATEKRKDFLRMIRDAEEKRDFCAILCWDMDRFGRFDSIEAGRWIHPLRQAGVWLITAAQGQIDWNDFAGRMMYSIQQEGKHQYLIDLSRNVLRGRIASARRGAMIVTPPYGFDRVFFDQAGNLVKRVAYGERFQKPDKWTVALAPAENKQEVETARWLFHRFAEEDCSVRSLVLDLNARGVPARRGKGWSSVSVRYLLSHPAYVGTFCFGRRRTGKYHQVSDAGDLTRAGRKAMREEAPIFIENAHEGLVDRELFERVQKRLRRQAKARHKPRYNGAVLTGVVRCGHCGRPMCGKSSGSKGRKGHRYYYCPGIASGRCATHTVRQDYLERYVFQVITDRFFRPEVVKRFEVAIHRLATQDTGFQAAVDGLRRQIDALDVKIKKGTENLLLASPEHFDTLAALLGEWQAERARLQGELQSRAVNASGTTAEERAERAIAELQHLKAHFQSGDRSRVRAVVKAMVEDITLWWEKNGPRQVQVSKGLMTFKSDTGVLESFSSTASARHPRESGGL